MISMEFGPGAIVGVGLVVIGIFLYALGKREPNVSRYYDFFLSPIGLLCGGILIFQGWRLDPILLLSETLLSGIAIFLVIENLYLRTKRIKISQKTNQQTKLLNTNCSEISWFDPLIQEDSYKELRLGKVKRKIILQKQRRVAYTRYLLHEEVRRGSNH
uniref:hypothetical chloroplast RF66 n=1 Tax=Trichomanes auriculatum TaxID=381226 RepID=UPI0028D63D5D|nr:hypothetical chloroplast RF66 [Vandenboschia auriculata]ALO81810.1 hypothetical chloroplast RF66 [Vandenboschia auriculata]